MLTIRDIAKKAKVSVATISRFLHPETKHFVHPETQERVEKIVQKYRYIPNQAARALSKQATNTIGMVTAFSTDVVKSPYYEGLISGVIEGIRSFTYDLKWVMIKDEEIPSCNLQDLLQKHAVDGVVFLTWSLYPKLIREIEHHSNLPAVLINDYEPNVRSSIIYCDSSEGVRELCAHFLAKGYKTIGMMRGPEYISLDAKERFNAFKKASLKLKFRLNPKFLYECPRFDEKAAFEVMTSWIVKGALPRAIFCANDDLVRGALRALKQEKIRVPEQVAIAGFDDSWRNEVFIPSVTSIRQPLEVMGRVAVETLINIIARNVKPPIQVRFKPELIIRNST